MKITQLHLSLLLFFSAMMATAQTSGDCGCGEYPAAVTIETLGDPCTPPKLRAKDVTLKKVYEHDCCVKKCKEKQREEKRAAFKRPKSTPQKKQKPKIAKQSKLDFLAKDTKSLKNKTKNLAQRNNSKADFLSKYNQKNKMKSIDDFLKKSNNSSNDFLSKSNSNSTDFLATSGSKKGEITFKNGKYGVVNKATGKILIPFKNWIIDDFKAGIARVRIEVDSYARKCSKAFGKYAATAYRTGYVDRNANFIDGSKITFRGGWRSTVVPGLTLVVGNDTRSYAEQQAAKRRAEQREKLAREACRTGYIHWKEQTINTYH